MPTIKNTTDEDIYGPVGVGLVKAGETKVVADPVEFTGLKTLTDEEANAEHEKRVAAEQKAAENADQIQAVEPAAPVAPAPVAPQPQPQVLQAVEPAPQQAPAVGQPAAEQTNHNLQGA